MIFEMHLHTKYASACGHIDPDEHFRLYKDRGFDGIVVTDHFNAWSQNHFTHFEESVNDFASYCDFHFAAYEKAKKAGEKYGLTVLYGQELRLNATGANDYLVYGMTSKFLKQNADIFDWSVPQLVSACEENGFVCYQAHPFRNGMLINSPQDLYGVEVYNGNPCTRDEDNQRNTFADMWADKYNLHKIAGSDCHDIGNLGTAGIITHRDVHSEKELVEVLRSDEYRIFHTAAWTK